MRKYDLHADSSLQRDHARVTELANRLINGITSQVEHVIRNGDPNGYPGCVNLSFAYVEGESLLMALKVCFATFRNEYRLTRRRTSLCRPAVPALRRP